MTAVSWRLSVGLQTVPESVSWFLPAGLRVATLIFTRPRDWWLLWLSEIAALPLPSYALGVFVVGRFGSDQSEPLYFSPLRVSAAAALLPFLVDLSPFAYYL